MGEAMTAPENKPWRFTGARPATPGANWTTGGAYRNLPPTSTRPDPRAQRTATNPATRHSDRPLDTAA
ncbi:hypothetical protein GCM10009745_43660 [Kribbella yunnanensis]|uniref:Uncharacterized protein n=1 Tax=Kribbella yunnanensis TaxID=190194 RepID=A0ABP4TTF8_9ACTN